MKSTNILNVTICFVLLALGVRAQAPQKMSYQAVVRNTTGALIANSPVGMQISILQGSSTGLAVFIERHSITTNANGLASLEIGSGTPVAGSFSAIDWSAGSYYIKTEADPTGGTVYSISGTSQLLSVPYALYAETSGSGGGSGGGGSLDQAYDQGGAGLGRSITTDAGAVQINNAGSNTIGMEVNTSVAGSTAYLANVSGTGVGFRAESTVPSNTYAAIQANTNSTGTSNSAILGNNTGAGYGVSGQIPNTATGFAAVYGNNLRTSGGVGVNGQGFNGVSGSSTYNQGYGIFGQNTAVPNIASAFYATAVAGVGGVGVQGQTQNGQLPGVFGQNLNNGVTYNNIAVQGSSNTGVGVWGENLDGSFYGVYSNGDLGASGVKTFKIDHPADPENKYLVHFSIESDEVLNIYRGNAVFNEAGEAVVELEEYIELINKNFTYQLTPIGGAAPVFIKEKVSNGKFVIAGGVAGMEVSWQLTGERNDPYLQQKPEKRQVIVEKRASERGQYLIPALYGKPQSSRINYIPQYPITEQK
jgi:hypothetical protein